MICYYRLSSAGHDKPRVADRQTCLASFLAAYASLKHRIVIMADNYGEDWLWDVIQCYERENVSVEHTALGNTGSFLAAMARGAADAPDQTVYLVEDDYLHMPGGAALIEEGLAVADYVTLYDCPDKYSDPSPNPNVIDGIEKSSLLINGVKATKSTHWRYTGSTTCTFAAKAKTLAADLGCWRGGSVGMDAPADFHTFTYLSDIIARTVAVCIPGRATHTELPWLTPFVDWRAFAQDVGRRVPGRAAMDVAAANHQRPRVPNTLGIGEGLNVAMAG